MIRASLPIQLVLADRPCRGLEIATDAGIDAVLLERQEWGTGFDRDSYSRELADVLASHHIDLVAMAGFGTILEAPVFEAFDGSIINTHPALLPSFPGWHGVRDALDYGVKVTGCTIHVATPKVDDGPILAQEAVSVLPGDDEGELHERIKAVERRLYIDTLRTIVERGHVVETQ